MITQPSGADAGAFQLAIPTARMKRFNSACAGLQKDAMRLYVLDAHLAAHLHGLCRLLEVALREAVHKQMTARLGNRWFDIDDGTFDDDFTSYVTAAYDEFARRRNWSRVHKSQVSPDDLIAELKMGAWRNLLSKGSYSGGVSVKYDQTLWPGDNGINAAFKARFGMATAPDFAQISSLVQRFVSARNRISHCEPVVFGFPQSKKTKGNKPIRRTVGGIVHDIRLLYSFIHPDLEAWVLGHTELNALLLNVQLTQVENYLIKQERVQLSGRDLHPPAR